MRIIIVGCGAIGTTLAKAANEMVEVKKIYLIDQDRERAEKLNEKLDKGMVVDCVEDELYHADLVVEAASQEAAKGILTKTVGRGVDIMLMSVGALVDDDYREAVFAKAAECDARIFIPSGALVGADGLRAASMLDGLESVELTSITGPSALQNVKYLIDKGIDVNSVKERKELYSGSAREAVIDFPQNVNLAATVSLLGLGFDKTMVKIILDPNSKELIHELRIKGKYGTIVSQTHNVPTADNPKSSELGSMSTIEALRRIIRNEWIGI